MTYPTVFTELSTMINGYTPAVSNPAYSAAVGTISPVSRIVGVFNALKDVDSLDEQGRRILCGAAHLIATLQHHELRGEAATVRDAVAPTLPA
jgi:hypothetical protein